MRKLLLGTLLLASIICDAQWNPTSTENNPVITSTTNSKGDVVMVSDGAGGSFVVWTETRGATGSDIYIQRINSAGNQVFAADGLVVCNADNTQSNVVGIPDSAGGVILLWQDIRLSGSSSQADIYMQRIAADGTPAWAANGIPVINSSNNENGVSGLTVSASQFALVWRDGRNGNLDLYANYFLISTGARVNASDIEVVAQPNTQTRQVLAADGAGGFIAAWEDPRISTAETDIFIQRVNAAGSPLWGANGKAAVSSSFNQLQPAIHTDGAGGAVVVWTDNRISATDQNVYAQRFNAAGDVQWAANGVAVVSATGNQNNAFIINDGSTNSIIVWSDNRVSVSDRNIYAQKLNATGDAQWAANGVGICTVTFNQPNAVSSLVIVSDGSDGAIIGWDDNRANNTTTGLDVYAQRISGAGNILWTADGVPVGNRSASNQRVPVMIPSDGNRAMVAFLDGRSGTANASIYISQLESNGTLPVSIINFKASNRSNIVDLVWESSNEQNLKQYVVEKSADGKNFSPIGAVMALNKVSASYKLEDKYPGAGDNYYRLRSVDFNGALHYSNVIRLNFSGRAGRIVRTYPNPVRDNVLMELINLEKGQYSIRTLNLNGAVLSTQAIQVAENYRQVMINTNSLPKGSYVLQIVSNQNEIIGQEKIMKL